MKPETDIDAGGTTRYRIANEADATRAVVAANRHGVEAGLNAVDAQSVSTAASELARNILKFAGSGELLFREVRARGERGLVLTARDRGPGIADIEAAMRDHFSSSGTLGLGLPGVKRMMHEFHIESEPGKYTTVSCLKWNRPPRADAPLVLKSAPEPEPTATEECAVEHEQLEFADYGRPCRGEYVSGDLALVAHKDQYQLLAVIDGLGHGPEAHKVAQRARDFLLAYWSADVVATMRRLHDSLRGSIGAVAGLAVYDMSSGLVRYTGVGNTAYRAFGSRDLRLVSSAGSLGHQIRSPQEQTHVLAEGDVLVMYSDGIKDRFDREDYPQLPHQSAEVVARTVVERFGKPHDDATCLVARRSA